MREEFEGQEREWRGNKRERGEKGIETNERVDTAKGD